MTPLADTTGTFILATMVFAVGALIVIPLAGTLRDKRKKRT